MFHTDFCGSAVFMFESIFSDFGEIKFLEETKQSLSRQNLALARTYSTHPIPNLRNMQMIRNHV
jgi:hypothetical protein